MVKLVAYLSRPRKAKSMEKSGGLSSLVLPSREWEEASSTVSSIRDSTRMHSPLTRLLSSPLVGKKLQKSGILEDVEGAFNELTEELEMAQKEMGQLKEENEKLQDSLEIGQMERSAKMVEVVQLQGGLLTAHQETNSLKEENARLQTVLMTEVSEIEEEMQATQQQYLTFKNQHETALAELEQTKLEKNNLTLEVNKLQSRLIGVLERTSQQLMDLQAVHQEKAGLKAQVIELQSMLRTVQQEKFSLLEEIEQLQIDFQAVQDERDDLENLVREIVGRRNAQQSAQKAVQLRADVGKLEGVLQTALALGNYHDSHKELEEKPSKE